MRLLLTLLVLLAAVMPSAAQSDKSRKYFEDWLVACRDDGYCSATAYVNPNPGNGSNADYVFRVGRHAEESYWELSFSTVATMGLETEPFTLTVDGKTQRFQGADQVAPYGSINDFYFLGKGAQQVMDWLAPSRSLAVAFVDTDGVPQEAKFSLAGLNAALVWIDEEQKRLGSERVAETPPVGLAMASAAGANTAIPPKALAWLAADTECIAALPAEPEIIMLSPTQRAYILPCWEAAYNRGAKVFVEQSGFLTPAFFAEYNPASGWTATDYLVNHEYDASTGILSTFYRGTGMGNCGSIGKYVWGGYAFRLVEFRNNDDCDAPNDPGDFPLVFSESAPAKP